MKHIETILIVLYISIAAATPFHAYDNISYVDKMDRVTGAVLQGLYGLFTGALL